MLDDLYRQVVLDHAKYKRNYGELSEQNNISKVYYKNPTCGDVMTLYLRTGPSGIEDLSFEGEGCSISMASCSMMTDLLKNQSMEAVYNKRDAFERLIREGEIEEDIDLGDAAALQGVHKLRARHNCALMPWQALDKWLKEQENERE
ncbi:zinc-dependent sulfurtransferase SufU [Halobacillus andaensis]|uniref:Zinc-dependent sulfurtransferase SufU n=1 Tax=Halobacillus andaensis TaxID=1176239 RepID=A0A917EWR3_HALAA|nr:SUF system NifU family Fe-S cluster assembly protein [Halobacillus andaensis]MBP2006485.1 nitrogen fixation NifU-like protein [Halobacillus andaensis]GGF27710.1 zinc-dependent sulfurtransferase SufU [Halobacillus andaensis]